MPTFIRSDFNKKATSGEKKVAKLFNDTLGEEDLIYYEPLIKGIRPDFVLILKYLGVVVVEVKDYLPDMIKSANPDWWSIKSNHDGIVDKRTAPERQAVNYKMSLVNVLKKNPNLLKSDGSCSSLKVRYAHMVVFTHLTALDIMSLGLNNIISSDTTLFSNDLNMRAEDIWSFLENIFPYGPAELSSDDIDNIRFSLFPEIRINKNDTKYDENNLEFFRDITLMDRYQETLAKQLGEGHRLLRGVTGSGKTLILTAFAKLQAQRNPEWKILILSYGSVMSNKLKRNINEKEFPNISVMTFLQFMMKEFRLFSLDSVELLVGTNYFEDKGLPVYDCIIIEEGQDFSPEWISLLAKCVNSKTQSFLLVEDKAQDIYRRRKSLKELTGLDFRGRSRILKINYRNTKQVAKLAWDFLCSTNEEIKKDVEIIHPESTKRIGPQPTIGRFNTSKEEASFIADKIKLLLDSGVPPEDIAVLYRVKTYSGVKYIDILQEELSKRNITSNWLTQDTKSKSKAFSKLEGINIVTLDSSKGLDFPHVFIYSAHLSPLSVEKDKSRESSLFYIGLTRATESLTITHTKTSEFVDTLYRLLK